MAQVLSNIRNEVYQKTDLIREYDAKQGTPQCSLRHWRMMDNELSEVHTVPLSRNEMKKLIVEMMKEVGLEDVTQV